MQNVYEICFYGGLVLAILLLIAAIVLFIVLKIPKVIGELTGSAAKKAMKEMQDGTASPGSVAKKEQEKYYNMGFGKEELEHEFERNARTAEAEQSKRAASRVKPTEPDRAGKQSAQRSVGDVERELRGIDEAVKSRTSKGRAEQAERRRAEQEAHQRAEAERRAAEEQQRIASRRYIGRDWEPER